MIEHISCYITLKTFIHPSSSILSANYHNYTTRRSTVVTENIASSSYGQCKLDFRSNFFFQGVVSPWNDLPAYVKNSVSIGNFKTNYDKEIF